MERFCLLPLVLVFYHFVTKHGGNNFVALTKRIVYAILVNRIVVLTMSIVTATTVVVVVTIHIAVKVEMVTTTILVC